MDSCAGGRPAVAAARTRGSAGGDTSVSRNADNANRRKIVSIARFPSNDLENADRFVADHGREVRYCYAWNRWLAWDGRRWRREAQGEIETRAAQTTRKMLHDAANLDGEAMTAALKWARASHSTAKRAAMLDSAHHMTEVKPAELDADPWALNAGNGIVDLRTLNLRPHDPAALMTRLAGAPYDPKAGCPTWLAFLARVFDGDEDLVAFVQRLVGYSLTGDRREQVFSLAIGVGANGKSTMLDALATVLGDYALRADFKTFLADPKHAGRDKGPDLARLQGVRLVMAAEPNAGSQLDESVIKTLTGDATITGRYLYGEPFEFRPECKIWLAANEPPRLPRGGEAMRRRTIVLPFDTVIPEPERDPELGAKLAAEASGILRWALEGCLAWQGDRLQPPEKVLLARDEYLEENDPVGDFLATLERRRGAEAGLTAVYNAYRRFTDAAGCRPLSSQGFSNTLRTHGYQIERRHGARFVLDVETPPQIGSTDAEKNGAGCRND